MSILQTLNNFFFRDEHNEDYICASCPIHKYKESDLKDSKIMNKIEKYCKKHYGDSVIVDRRFSDNKVDCIIKETQINGR